MTPREVVRKSILFQRPDRIPYDLPEQYGSDFAGVGMTPSPDERPKSGVDEWGCVWENIGASNLGEVKDVPLKDWADWDRLSVPDIRNPDRWQSLPAARERASASGSSASRSPNACNPFMGNV